uniref:Secreted protein n=2 Tax=Schistosoma TaxID=6181 RepID=A0A5K4F7S3_SCHMA
MMIMMMMRSFNLVKMISLLLFSNLLIISIQGVVIPEANPIDYQSKRWTDFKRAIRWSEYPFTFTPEIKRHYLYEQRPYYNDILV